MGGSRGGFIWGVHPTRLLNNKTVEFSTHHTLPQHRVGPDGWITPPVLQAADHS